MTERATKTKADDSYTFKTTVRNPKFSSTIFKATETIPTKCLLNALMNAENTLITSRSKLANLKPFLKALFTKIRVDGSAVLGEITTNTNKKFIGWTLRQSQIKCYDAIEHIRIDITGSDNESEPINNDDKSSEFFNFRKLPKSDFVEVTIYRSRFHSVNAASRDTETKILFSNYETESIDDDIDFPDREILMKSLQESTSGGFDVTSQQIAN